MTSLLWPLGWRPRQTANRNPMGLADTSPTPKKDSMGMDYIPFTKDTDDGSVKLLPGKIQRTGVKSEPLRCE